MKTYPSIPKMLRNELPTGHVYCFNKVDGSNFRAEWNNKRCFYKFGTKTQLIDENTKPWGMAIELLKSKYAEDLTMVFEEQKWKEATCFFELYGSNSFAGNHVFDETMTITLLDVNPYKQGILVPALFLKLFGHLDIPKVLYQGIMTPAIFDQVKHSQLEGMSLEGVVVKGSNHGQPVMWKIKSQVWLDQLKEHCKDDDELFNKLA